MFSSWNLRTQSPGPTYADQPHDQRSRRKKKKKERYSGVQAAELLGPGFRLLPLKLLGPILVRRPTRAQCPSAHAAEPNKSSGSYDKSELQMGTYSARANSSAHVGGGRGACIASNSR